MWSRGLVDLGWPACSYCLNLLWSRDGTGLKDLLGALLWLLWTCGMELPWLPFSARPRAPWAGR